MKSNRKGARMDIEHAKNTGDGELAKIFDYLQKGNDTNIKICMFDRDNQKYIFSDTFLKGNNLVYKFNLCTPKHRGEADLQSVPRRERPHEDRPDADRAEHPHAGHSRVLQGAGQGAAVAGAGCARAG